MTLKNIKNNNNHGVKPQGKLRYKKSASRYKMKKYKNVAFPQKSLTTLVN